MDVPELMELVALICSKDISEFEMEREGLRLRIVRPTTPEPSLGPGALPLPAPIEAGAVRPESVTRASLPAKEKEGLFIVTSPIVGTFYRAPSPTADPYVAVGDVIKKGQVLCIVEAMKLMNEIESEIAGTVVEIPLENGQPVEYGEVLFKIRPTA